MGYKEDDFIRYRKFHYYHPQCYIESGKPLAALDDEQIVKFSADVVSAFDLAGDVQAALVRLRGGDQ